jgi:phage N-6-adenine-methyltransferase
MNVIDNDWATPDEVFKPLNDEFNFETDLCALPWNAKCKKFFTPEMDGLKQRWRGVCWLNPPFGNQIGKWIQKAYEASLRGAIVVCLVPTRTETIWWHNYCLKGEIRFLRGRINFIDKQGRTGRPRFGSALVIFRPTVSDNTRQ